MPLTCGFVLRLPLHARCRVRPGELADRRTGCHLTRAPLSERQVKAIESRLVPARASSPRMPAAAPNTPADHPACVAPQRLSLLSWGGSTDNSRAPGPQAARVCLEWPRVPELVTPVRAGLTNERRTFVTTGSSYSCLRGLYGSVEFHRRCHSSQPPLARAQHGGG